MSRGVPARHSGLARAWRAGLGATMAAALAAPAVLAFPEGAPWDAAGGEGCHQCHFDAPPVAPSSALSLGGLPARIEPGARYPLVVRLEDEALVNAGFMLAAWRTRDGVGAVEAGRFEPSDGNVAADGARARSTEAGSRSTLPGLAEWPLVWHAPDALDAPIVFELWANAGNDDKSPFGDTTHYQSFELAIDAGNGAAHSTQSPRTTE